tara:strand:- start:243 stop:1901 length:1659 start_codon:yes stop_codon:yes gene_type:complete
MHRAQWIIILVIVATVAVIFFNKKSQNKKSRKRRARDRRPLQKHEKRLYQQALKLAKEKEFISAAQIMESIGMLREAVDLLEFNGLIDQACNALTRNGHHQRAAVVYSRHKKMKEASICYERVQLFGKAADAAKKSSDIARALRLYEINNNYKEAADCHIELGEFAKAAKLLVKNGFHNDALQLYPTILQNTPKLVKGCFDIDEVDIVQKHYVEGDGPVELCDILISEERAIGTIVSLIKSERFERAKEFYLRSVSNLGPDLLAIESFDIKQSRMLADLLSGVSNFKYAGFIYERLNDFEKAGKAFETADEFERAAHCYERAGDKKSAITMRCRIAETGSQTPIKDEISITNPFQMDLADTAMETKPDASKVLKNIAEPNELEAATIIHTNLPSINNSLEVNLKVENFNKSKFCQPLEPQERESLWKIGDVISFDKGEIIIDVNEEPSGVFFILEGDINLYRIIEEKLRKIDVMTAPGSFGEFWLLIELKSSVRFEANSPSTLLKIERMQFNNLMDKNGTIARKIYKAFTSRLTEKLLTKDNNNGSYPRSAS